jgi:DNA-binding MarR family transcriptional regulator
LSVAQLEFLSCLAKAGLVVRSGGTTNRRTALLDLTAALPKATRRSLGSSLPALRELTGAVDALADDVLQDARQIADEATA